MAARNADEIARFGGLDTGPRVVRLDGAALSDLDPVSRPVVVRVVADLPRTTWFRVRKEPLRAQGFSDPADLAVWRLDPAPGTYQLAPDRLESPQ
jgi:hypothetical protein